MSSADLGPARVPGKLRPDDALPALLPGEAPLLPGERGGLLGRDAAGRGPLLHAPHRNRHDGESRAHPGRGPAQRPGRRRHRGAAADLHGRHARVGGAVVLGRARGAGAGDRSRIGAITVQRMATDSSADVNRTYGVDGRIGLGDAWTEDWWGAKIHTPTLTGDEYGYSARVGYQTSRWNSAVRYLQVGEDFSPEVGFLNGTPQAGAGRRRRRRWPRSGPRPPRVPAPPARTSRLRPRG